MYCVSHSSPFPVLGAVFWFRRTPLTVPTLSKEWWVTVARTAAIDCCSCLSSVCSHQHKWWVRLERLPREKATLENLSAWLLWWLWWLWWLGFGHDVNDGSLAMPHHGLAPNSGGHVPVHMTPSALHVCAGPSKLPLSCPENTTHGSLTTAQLHCA